jgi:hypothetical protein
VREEYLHPHRSTQRIRALVQLTLELTSGSHEHRDWHQAEITTILAMRTLLALGETCNVRVLGQTFELSDVGEETWQSAASHGRLVQHARARRKCGGSALY